jgi:transposase-like protein
MELHRNCDQIRRNFHVEQPGLVRLGILRKRFLVMIGKWRKAAPMASKKASKGKRYTAEEKQQVVDFVNKHNAANGRGGATAASKKFGVSQLTVGSWLKSSGIDVGDRRKRSTAAASAGRGSVLAELSKLDGVIAAKRKELDALEARFQELKASL